MSLPANLQITLYQTSNNTIRIELFDEENEPFPVIALTDSIIYLSIFASWDLQNTVQIPFNIDDNVISLEISKEFIASNFNTSKTYSFEIGFGNEVPLFRGDLDFSNVWKRDVVAFKADAIVAAKDFVVKASVSANAQGVKGDTGWSAVLAVVEDGERRVHQVVDWEGGQGAKPNTGQYLGENGFVQTPAEATDIRGSEGSGKGIESINLISTQGLEKTYRITFTDNTNFDYTVTDGEAGNGIDSIALFSTIGKEKTYRITFTDNSTFDYTVTDGDDGADGADGADGENGADGVGINNIQLVSTVGLAKTYRITFTDSSTYDYVVTDGQAGENGTDGENGENGADGVGISNIQLISTNGLEKTYRITFTDNSIFDYVVTDGQEGEDGKDGENGADGADGRGISNVQLISTNGLEKTYRITFTDATTFNFVVTDGIGVPDSSSADDGLVPTTVNGAYQLQPASGNLGDLDIINAQDSYIFTDSLKGSGALDGNWIVSGTVNRSATGATLGNGEAYIDTGATDHIIVSCETFEGTAARFSLILSYIDDSNFILVQRSNGDVLTRISKVDNGVVTQLAVETQTGVAMEYQDISVEFSGTFIIVKTNLHPPLITTLSNADRDKYLPHCGKVGFGSYDNNGNRVNSLSAKVRNFRVRSKPFADTDTFIIQIDTTEGDGENRMRLPIQGTDMVIDWGDGTIETVTQTATPSSDNWVTHNYAEAGIYNIAVSNTIERVFFANTGDKLKLVKGLQWGTAVWTTMNSAFRSCDNFVGDFSDTPDLSSVTDMSRMFFNAPNFNQDIGNWSVDNVTSMFRMFQSASSFNQDIGNWSVENVTDMDFMFDSATSFNQDLSGWCVSQFPTEPSNFANNTPNWTLPKPNWGQPCS